MKALDANLVSSCGCVCVAFQVSLCRRAESPQESHVIPKNSTCLVFASCGQSPKAQTPNPLKPFKDHSSAQLSIATRKNNTTCGSPCSGVGCCVFVCYERKKTFSQPCKRVCPTWSCVKRNTRLYPTGKAWVCIDATKIANATRDG